MRVTSIFAAIAALIFGLSTPAQAQSFENSPIDWLSVETAVERNTDDPKPYLIFIYNRDGWSRLMMRRVFSDPLIIEELKNHHVVKFHVRTREPVQLFNRTWYFDPSSVTNGVHQFLVALLGTYTVSTPTLVLLNREFAPVERVLGYTAKEDLLPLMIYVREEGYRRGSFQTWREKYKSPYVK